MGEEYVRAIEASALAAERGHAVILRRWPLLICHSKSAFYALLNRCSHAGAPLEGGRIKRGLITCPLHGAPFRLEDGRCAASAANYSAIRTFDTRVVDGWVEVAIPEQEPSHEDLPVAVR